MPPEARFDAHAHRQMASMFDDVSARYDLLNRLMTLGQDGAWREAMWRRVPEDAAHVLDLCTGSGVSLPGLQRPGRLLLGADVSLQMLEVAQRELATFGWGPRLVCADAFRLPLRAASLDAVTVAFGVRNLRPRVEALTEIARALRPGGALVVLEATAPAPGPLAPGHTLWLRHVVPAMGRLSPDPSAYRYLSASIFEFGAGPEFERDLAAAGFAVRECSRYLLGATTLWVAERLGQVPDAGAAGVQAARGASGGIPQASSLARAARARAAEARTWLGVQAVVAAALAAGLMWALMEWSKSNGALPLSEGQRWLGWGLLIAGLVGSAVRAGWLALRWSTAATPRGGGG